MLVHQKRSGWHSCSQTHWPTDQPSATPISCPTSPSPPRSTGNWRDCDSDGGSNNGCRERQVENYVGLQKVGRLLWLCGKSHQLALRLGALIYSLHQVLIFLVTFLVPLACTTKSHLRNNIWQLLVYKCKEFNDSKTWLSSKAGLMKGGGVGNASQKLHSHKMLSFNFF